MVTPVIKLRPICQETSVKPGGGKHNCLSRHRYKKIIARFFLILNSNETAKFLLQYLFVKLSIFNLILKIKQYDYAFQFLSKHQYSISRFKNYLFYYRMIT